MRSFVVGRVLEPELKTTKQGKRVLEFGMLVGRESVVLSVWDEDSSFGYALSLHGNERVIAIINAGIDKRDSHLRYYVNNLAPAPEGLRESLLALFMPEAPNAAAIPEPPQPKKAGV